MPENYKYKACGAHNEMSYHWEDTTPDLTQRSGLEDVQRFVQHTNLL